MLYLISIDSKKKEVITIRKVKKNIKIIFFIMSILLCMISQNVYASDEISAEIELSDAYVNWYNLSEDEKENTSMPSMYNVDMPDEILEKQVKKISFSKIIRSHTYSIIQYPVSNDIMKAYYNLNDHYDIEVRNQGIMQCCWAVATLNSMEINEQIRTGNIANYSERHMDFATSEDFSDGINPNAFKRSVESGGTALIGLAYLTNGQGAVLEEEMPFENDLNPITLSEIDIEPSVYVTDYAYIPGIYKYYNEDGSAVYYGSNGNFYTDEEVKVIRDNVKKHIVNYGGVIAYTAASQYDYYSSPDLVSSEAYYYNGDASHDHAIVIVGWDDNYSKDNFTGKAKPTKDGAYIVLNSYSDEIFNDGYLYISYEDKWIETALYGVENSSDIDYDHLYQHDFYGGGVPITLYDSIGNTPKSIYYASTYEKALETSEELTSVSVNSNEYCNYEIYVNPNGKDLKFSSLVKIASTETLSPGYHQIDVEKTKLNGSEFTIVIKATALDEKIELLVEPQLAGTFYEYADSKEGNSLISLNGINWQNLSDLGKLNYGGIILDTAKSDVCIKAYTTEIIEETPGEDIKPDDGQKPDEELPGDDTKPGDGQKPDEELPGDDTKPDEEQKPSEEIISSEKYNILENKYISKIEVGTTILDVCNEINFTNTYKIYDKDNNEIKDYKTLVRTGMYIETNNQKYYLVVRTDVNGDGKMSLIDLSRALAHIYETEGYTLEGAELLACDLSLDGIVSLKDFSQFLSLYNSL